MSETSHLTRLQDLHLYGMATAWREWQAESTRSSTSIEAVLLRLLDAEQADRQARSLNYQLKGKRPVPPPSAAVTQPPNSGI